MIVAVAFDDGFLVACPVVGRDRMIGKVAWGLVVAGEGPLDEGFRRRLAVRTDPEPMEIASSLVDRFGSWLFTLEPEAGDVPPEGVTRRPHSPLGSPVGAYACEPGEERAGGAVSLRRLTWGAVLSQENDDTDAVARAGLVLQEGLDHGTGADERLLAVVQAFAWLGERDSGMGPEIEVGFHESERRFSVDRLSWRLHVRRD